MTGWGPEPGCGHTQVDVIFFFFLKELLYLLIYLFFYFCCVGSSFLCEGFL